jgi:hypothetical protein
MLFVFSVCLDKMTTTNTLDWFYAPTRIVSDKYSEEAKTFENNSGLTRQTASLTAGCSETLNPAAAIADQVGLIPRGAFGTALGCKIDEHTELRWGTPGAWRHKGPHQLWARPFATTPALGKGDPGKVGDETSLIFSAPPRNRKEASTIMDKAIPNFFDPLIPQKQEEHSNPQNWIYDWTRGGDATRLVQTQRRSV